MDMPPSCSLHNLSLQGPKGKSLRLTQCNSCAHLEVCGPVCRNCVQNGLTASRLLANSTFAQASLQIGV